MRLYGPRFRIKYSWSWKYLVSWKYWKTIFLLSAILEILEIEVFNILYNPGNIGNCIFLIFSYPGNTGNWIFYFLISWKYWKLKSATFSITWKYGRRAGGGGRAAPGVVLCCLGLFLEHVSWNFRISWKYWKCVFSIFLDLSKKGARRNFTQDAPTDEPRSLIWDRFRPEN